MAARFWVDHEHSPVWRQIYPWTLGEPGRAGDARLLRSFADEPDGQWGFCPCPANLDGPEKSIGSYVNRVADAAPDPVAQALGHVHEQAGAIPAVVIYELRHDRCGGWDGGGPAAAAEYRRRIDAYARGIGTDRVVVFLEPDGLPTSYCLTPPAQRTREALVRYAVDRFAALPATSVYIDAGASDWHPAREMAAHLRRAGVAQARGFVLNVTHYDWTGNNVRYGLDIDRHLGRHRRRHFVINTAYNGRGPLLLRRAGRRIDVWCNPKGRALGHSFTTRTANPLVDAYFWVGGPGYSDGTCIEHPGARPGGPAVGIWWADWALELENPAGGGGVGADRHGITPHARTVLERSLQETLNRSEGFIGVEHLLLALLRDEKSGASRTLERFGATADDGRKQLELMW